MCYNYEGGVDIMSKGLIKDSEFEKISGGNWKKFNRALDYTSAGVEAAAGIAAVGLLCGEEIKNHGFFQGIAREVKISPLKLLPLLLTAHGAWRITSRACDLYNDKEDNDNPED